MREILFRAKRVDNGEWVYGDLAHSTRSANGRKPHISWIVDGYFSNGGWLTPLTRYAVIDESVGQYTGLKDKNGTKIFEGDIVKTKYGRLCKVIWFASPCSHCWDLIPIETTHKTPDERDAFASNNLEIIGNIHDNPEPLGSEV